MKRIFFICMLITFGTTAFAEDYASTQDAVTLVTNIVHAITANREGTLREITNKDPKWVHGDLYPVIYDMDGKCIAHGQNAKQIGKDLIDMEDADGKEFVRERVTLATSHTTFWQDYKFTDPLTKKVLPKSAYCARTGNDIICAGVYKR